MNDVNRRLVKGGVNRGGAGLMNRIRGLSVCGQGAASVVPSSMQDEYNMKGPTHVHTKKGYVRPR